MTTFWLIVVAGAAVVGSVCWLTGAPVVVNLVASFAWGMFAASQWGPK